MAITNQNKEKNPVLEEIENDDTPIDDKGRKVEAPVLPTVEELLAKDPNDLSATDMDILSEHKDDLTDEQKAIVGLIDVGDLGEEDKGEIEQPPVVPEVKPVVPVEESQEDKDKRYKAQQTEAQVQAERSKALISKVDEADKLPDPTIDELKSFVAQDGVTWDELTTFEQGQAKRNYISEKKLELITEGVRNTQKQDAWASQVDDFIDTTNDKPEFVELSGNEGEFRKYAMKESHRGTPIDILLGAFLHNLPPAKPNRGSLFNSGGGGKKTEVKTGITDADQAKRLREENPREYARQIKTGKVKLDV